MNRIGAMIPPAKPVDTVKVVATSFAASRTRSMVQTISPWSIWVMGS